MSFTAAWEKFRIRATRHGNTPRLYHIQNRFQRRVVKVWNMAKWYIAHPDYLLHKDRYFSSIEFSITTNCTLRCKHCCHYIPRFEAEPFTPVEVLIEDLRKLLESLKWIDEFRVLGGEPLLHPGLPGILQFLLISDKIGMIEVVTNGTISPSEELVKLFPNERLNISVSNYGKLSCRINEYADNHIINTTISPMESTWLDHGDLTYQGKNEKELEKQYRICSRERCIFMNGKLFNCATSAYGSALNAVDIKTDEYIDYRNAQDKNDLREQLKRWKHRTFFSACNYCNYGTNRFVPIKVAEQSEK